MRILLLCLFICGKGFAQEAPITVLVTHFPPFIDKNDQSKGLSWQLLSDFATSKGVQIKAQFLPTARLLTHIEKGDWQATILGLPSDIKGQTSVLYANKKVSYGLLVKHHEEISLDGLHVAGIRTSGSSTIQTILKQQGVVFTEVNTLSQAYLMYEAKRIDAVLGVVMDGKVVGAKNLEEFVMAKKIMEIPFVLSLNKNNTKAMSAYKKLLNQTKN